MNYRTRQCGPKQQPPDGPLDDAWYMSEAKKLLGHARASTDPEQFVKRTLEDLGFAVESGCGSYQAESLVCGIQRALADLGGEVAT